MQRELVTQLTFGSRLFCTLPPGELQAFQYLWSNFLEGLISGTTYRKPLALTGFELPTMVAVDFPTRFPRLFQGLSHVFLSFSMVFLWFSERFPLGAWIGR